MPIDPAATTKAYLKDVERARQRGDATEHTYRSFFIGLMNGIAPKTLTLKDPKTFRIIGHNSAVTAAPCPIFCSPITWRCAGM